MTKKLNYFIRVVLLSYSSRPGVVVVVVVVVVVLCVCELWF